MSDAELNELEVVQIHQHAQPFDKMTAAQCAITKQCLCLYTQVLDHCKCRFHSHRLFVLLSAHFGYEVLRVPNDMRIRDEDTDSIQIHGYEFVFR